MTEKQILFWIFVGIFTITAAITLLGITGVIKGIKDKYLNSLFTALILEVVAAVVLVFQGFDFTDSPEAMIQEAGLHSQMNASQLEPRAFIIERLRRGGNGSMRSARADSLEEVLREREEELATFREEMSEFDRSFYMKILRLRRLMKDKYGGFINIAFRETEKEDVYQLLVDIFGEIGRIEKPAKVWEDEARTVTDKKEVRKIYRRLRKDYGRPTDGDHRLYITEYDTIIMMREYLNAIQPVREG